jgi:tetratricopeptide (TPR) repeat protein
MSEFYLMVTMRIFLVGYTCHALKYKRSFPLLFLALVISLTASGQDQKQWTKQGDRSYRERDYYGASLYYKKAMDADSSNLEIVYKYAESLRLYNEYELGEKYFQYIYSRDKNKNFKEVLFWLASMQKYNAKYQDARKNFLRFTKIYKDKTSFLYRKAVQETKSCEFAQELMNDTVPIVISNAGPSVNTVNAEFGTFLTEDSTLYFSSLRTDKIKETKEVYDPEYQIKIYTAVKTDSSWKLTGPVPASVNYHNTHNANGVFSKDKKQFYFTRCDKDFHCSIWVSEVVNGNFENTKMLPEINLEGFTSTHPHIALCGNKEVLIFASDRPGGYGRLDIWYAEKDHGQYTKIRNAGKNINSIDDEVTPFYDLTCDTLYFSSGWHYGLGGYDIFKSPGKPGAFKAPVNIGYPYNTSTNDFYYSYAEKSKTGFITSNRKGSITSKGETCCNDLWFFEKKDEPIPDPILPVANEVKLEQYLPVKLYFHNDEPDPKNTDTVTVKDYMQTYKEYTAKKEEYIKEYSQGLKDQDLTKTTRQIQDFFQDEVDKGAKDLALFTEQLLKQLESGKRIEIAVRGYASPLAHTDYNVPLTLRRISSMENYIKSYRNGAYLPYFSGTAPNGGHLSIIKVPFGEYKALGHVNDNAVQKHHSIYSPDAARERKIEIFSVTIAHQDSAHAHMRFKREIYNFGKTNEGDTLSYTFHFTNTGNQSVTITGVKDSCDCITTSWPRGAVAPGGTGTIELQFDTGGLIGKQVHHLFVESNATNVKELTVTAEILKEDK